MDEERSDRNGREEPGHRPEIPPLDVDGIRTVEVGTIIWAVAFLALLPFYGRLSTDGHTWWLWTCLAGFGLGAIGVEWCRRIRARRLADDAVGRRAGSSVGT